MVIDMNRRELSNREKVLLFVFAIGIIIFLYNFLLREPLQSKLDLINSETVQMEGEVEENSKSVEKDSRVYNSEEVSSIVSENSKQFGDFTSIESLIEETSMELISMSGGYVNEKSYGDLKLQEIDRNYCLRGNKANVLDFLNGLKSNENYCYEDIQVNRTDDDTYELCFDIYTLSLEDVPNSGISFVSESTEENVHSENDPLSDKVYKKEESEDSNTEKNVGEEIKPDKKPAVKYEDIARVDEHKETTKELDVKDKLNIFDIRNVESSLLSKLNYVSNYEYEYLNGADYIEAMGIENFYEENWDGADIIFTSNDAGVIEFASPIVIDSYYDYYLIELKSVAGDEININYKSSDESVQNHKITNLLSGWNIYEFYLPNNKSTFPLEIDSILSSGGNAISIKGILGVAK